MGLFNVNALNSRDGRSTLKRKKRSDLEVLVARGGVLLTAGSVLVVACVGFLDGETAARIHGHSAPRVLAAPGETVIDDRHATVDLTAWLDARTGTTAGAIVTRTSTVAIQYALAQLGKPYAWGATGPARFDCSGLTLRAFEAAGIRLPRTSRAQARVGARIPASAGFGALEPGDLVFWAYRPADLSTVHHVGIFVGDGQVLHAPRAGDVVRISPMWSRGYAGATRLG